MKKFGNIFTILAFNFSILPFGCGLFDVQYIGKYVPLKEATRRNFCGEIYCLSDANYLFEAASQTFDADPCIDFKEFTLGKFIKYRALNERYKFRGFQGDVEGRYKEKMRRVLNAKVDAKNDGRLFKVMKNFFKKCVTSKNVRENGTAEMVEYLNSLGSSPYLMRETQWYREKFNLSKLFDAEPDHSVWIFFDHKIARCPHPNNKSLDIVCLKLDIKWKTTRLNEKDVTEVLLDMNDSFQIGLKRKRELLAFIDRGIFYKSSFYNAKASHERFKKINKTIIKIKDIEKLTPDLNINWLKVFNDLLLKESQLTKDDEISIDDIELFKNLGFVLTKMDPEILAETFALTFLYNHQWFFNTYPFIQKIAETRGTKKAFQRWESCLFDINYKMSPALELLYSRTNYNAIFQEGVKNLTKDAIAEAINLIMTRTNLTNDVKDEVIDHIKSLKILAGLTKEFLSVDTDLENLYNQLPLNGNESYIDLWHETLRHIKKIENEPITRWKFQMNKLGSTTFTKILNNTLYIPSKWHLYPWFHPSRSKFFNVATIFTKILEVVLNDANQFIVAKWNVYDEFLSNIDADELSFEWYDRWLENGNTELKFGANRLTDRQLYWFALARKFYLKFQKNIPKDVNPIGRLQDEYLHVLYKSKPGFQKVYECNMTTKEEKTLQTYKNKLSKIKAALRKKKF